MKGAADGLFRRGKSTSIGLKLKTLHRKLGEATYRQHGQHSGPEELVTAIENAETEIREVQQKIDELEAAGQGRVLTPRRLLAGGVVAAVLFAFIGLCSILPPTTPLGSSTSSSTAGFFLNLPSNIDSPEFQGREISVTGIWSNRGDAEDFDGERIEGKIEVGLSTEYKDVSAVCRFDQADEKSVTVHGYFSSRGAVWFAKWAWRQAVR